MMIFFKVILLLPGTILHEFLHFIIGLLLNGKPVGFSLIPKKSYSGYILGSVSFRNITFYNAVPIALAPLLAIIPVIYLFNTIQYQNELIVQIFYGYLIWAFIQCAIPSIQDINVMFSSPVGIVFYIILGYIGYKIF